MVALKIPQDVAMPAASVPPVEKGSQLFTRTWYMFFETLRTRSGGDIDKVNDAVTGLDLKVDASTEIVLGNGLTGGGNLTVNVDIAALQDTGWTSATGTPNKGAYAVYAGQTVSVAYVQAEAQSTDDAVKAVSARLLAIEEALRANGAID